MTETIARPVPPVDDLPLAPAPAAQPETAPRAQSAGTITTTRVISYTYDPLNRLTGADYSSGEAFEYQYDAVGNRTALTSVTPLSGTIATTCTFDAANRLTGRGVSDGRVYSYTWSARGQMLAEHALSGAEEYTQGVAVRTFTYDGAARMVEAREPDRQEIKGPFRYR